MSRGTPGNWVVKRRLSPRMAPYPLDGWTPRKKGATKLFLGTCFKKCFVPRAINWGYNLESSTCVCFLKKGA